MGTKNRKGVECHAEWSLGVIGVVIIKIILWEIQDARRWLHSLELWKCCKIVQGVVLCEATVRSCTTQQTLGTRCWPVWSFFIYFLHGSGLVGYHCPCNQMKLLQSLMSEYGQSVLWAVRMLLMPFVQNGIISLFSLIQKKNIKDVVLWLSLHVCCLKVAENLK